MKSDDFLENCDANCDAFRKYALFLWLRNRTFYAMMETPRVNGKRRYKRLSLRTGNYYEAREKLKQMAMTIDKRIAKKFKSATIVNPYMTQKELNDLHDNLVQEYNEQYRSNHPIQLLNETDQHTTSKQVVITPHYTISEVIEKMLLKAQNQKEVTTRKKNRIARMLNGVGLSLSDDYSKFHTTDIITKIGKYIADNNSGKGDNKRQYIAHIRELATFGHNLAPDTYKMNIVNLLPDFQHW